MVCLFMAFAILVILSSSTAGRMLQENTQIQLDTLATNLKLVVDTYMYYVHALVDIFVWYAEPFYYLLAHYGSLLSDYVGYYIQILATWTAGCMVFMKNIYTASQFGDNMA
jgi:type III secretory pathway component EscS